MTAKSTLHGELPRPRAGFIGFDEEEVEAFKHVFGTIFAAKTERMLAGQVYAGDLDVVVSRKDPGEWVKTNHCIVFGKSAATIPLYDDLSLVIDNAEGTAFEAPTQPDPLFASLLKAYVDEIGTARGKPVIRVGRFYNDDVGWIIEEPETEVIADMGLLRATAPRGALALVIARKQAELGFAWFPTPPADVHAWTRAIVTKWSRAYPDAFPGVNDWEAEAAWNDADEARIRRSIEQLARRRSRIVARLDALEARLASELLDARERARKGSRRLLTAQADELVAATRDAFVALGFVVEEMDQATGDNEQRREDLRIRTPDDPNWEAIVEVKGLERGSARLEHVARISRHATRYAAAKGREPSQILFVLNAQFGVPPDLRARPWASAPHDAEAFAEANGLLVPTTDLFRILRDVNSGALSASASRALIVKARGVLQYPIDDDEEDENPVEAARDEQSTASAKGD